jgi:hypothetical protein
MIPDRLSGPPTLLLNGFLWEGEEGAVKLPKAEDDSSPSPSAEVKNEWSYNSTPLHASMSWIETKLPLALFGCVLKKINQYLS